MTRNTVPFGCQVATMRRDSSASASLLIGKPSLVHTTLVVTPGLAELVGGRSSIATTALPFASWPVTTRRNRNVIEGLLRLRLPAALLSAAAGQLDIAKRVDPGVEGTADHGRGLVLDDDRGAGGERPRREVAALVDRYLDKIGAVGVEHRAAARRRRVRRREQRRRGRLLMRHGSAQQQY